MSREIKFRIWDKKFKNWLTSGDGGTHCSSNWAIDPFTGKIINYVDCDGEYTPSEEPNRYFDGRDPIKESPFVKQQYTGLKDQNGVEIYEGDILKYETGLGPIYWRVYWNSEDGQWKINKEQGGNVGSWFGRHTVAGNIFENSELLTN
jgi:uncharacterized phage protein (TIGR01671 family)